jgi:hypothetical protein
LNNSFLSRKNRLWIECILPVWFEFPEGPIIKAAHIYKATAAICIHNFLLNFSGAASGAEPPQAFILPDTWGDGLYILSFVDFGGCFLQNIRQGLVAFVPEFSDLGFDERRVGEPLRFQPLLVFFVGLSQIMPG